jgi:hypothetical protein
MVSGAILLPVMLLAQKMVPGVFDRPAPERVV